MPVAFVSCNLDLEGAPILHQIAELFNILAQTGCNVGSFQVSNLVWSLIKEDCDCVSRFDLAIAIPSYTHSFSFRGYLWGAQVYEKPNLGYIVKAYPADSHLGRS